MTHPVAPLSTRCAPRLLVAGDSRHGVVRHANELAAAIGRRVGRDVMVPAAGVGDPAPLHLHFTDRLWGASPTQAAARVEQLAARTPLTVTLHDLPQESDGDRRREQRAAAYRSVACAARGVVVSSEHERALLRAVTGPWDAVTAVVIPLPVDRHPGPAPRAAQATPGGLDDEVSVLGFFYPGKGHAEAVAAVAELAGDPATRLGVTALGGASAGHEQELLELAAAAARRGVRFTITGYLDEATLLSCSRRTAVPVAPHQHLSASGSIGSWIAAGRRPLVPDSPAARELAALRPGTLGLYERGDLAGAIDRARRDPRSTWLAPTAALGPGLDDVAASYLTWWATGGHW